MKVRLVKKGTAKSPVIGRLIPKNRTKVRVRKSPQVPVPKWNKRRRMA
jgi:hypothetical protein